MQSQDVADQQLLAAPTSDLERKDADGEARLALVHRLLEDVIELRASLRQARNAHQQAEHERRKQLGESQERLVYARQLEARCRRLENESQERLAHARRLEARCAELTERLKRTEHDSQQRLATVRKLEARIEELKAAQQRIQEDRQRRLAALRDYAAEVVALRRLVYGGPSQAPGRDGTEGLPPSEITERPPTTEQVAPAGPGARARSSEHAHNVVTVIRPPRPTLGLDLREFWQFRHLYTMLVWRDIRMEFDATRLGPVWAIARPLLLTVVFTFFRRFSGANTGVDLPYALYVYTGLLLWAYFTDAATNAAAAIRADSALLTKIYYPRLLTPLVPIVSRLVTLAVGLVPLVAMMIWYEVRPGWALLLLPLFILQCVALALGMGTLISALAVENRDWERLLAFGLSIALWLSPVIYAPSMIPAQLHDIYMLNPTVGILLGFRAALFEPFPMPTWQIAYSSACCIAVLILGIWAFRRTEASLADRL